MKTHQTFKNLSLAFLLLMVAHASVHAQKLDPTGKPAQQNIQKSLAKAEPLVVTLVRQKVVLIDGKENLHSAEVAKPGDILDEVATYLNNSTAPIKQLQATLPVPPNTELLLASVKPGGAKASIDGNQFASMPLKRKVKQPNGVEIEQPIPIGEYRYLRWYPGELAPGKSLAFSARFKVSNDTAPTTASARK